MADLDALFIFGKVVECNGFSEASRRLGIPVSTLSRRVAELEDKLGARLLERSTRSIRITELGLEFFEYAQKTAEITGAVQSAISDRLVEVSGVVKVATPPSISDTILAPVITAFQAAYPKVRVQVLVTPLVNDQIDDSVDLALRVSSMQYTTMVARTLLTYRHQLLASPSYIEKFGAPSHPDELRDHRLLAFSFWQPESRWQFKNATTGETVPFIFKPYFAANDYAALLPSLLDGMGIGDLPPVVRPGLIERGRLCEVMTDWHFTTFDLSIVHPFNRALAKPVRLFKEFASQLIPTLFKALPA